MKYRVLKPILIGIRREVGEIIDLDEDQARAFGDEYVAPEPEPVTTGETPQGSKVEGEAAVKPKRTRRAK